MTSEEKSELLHFVRREIRLALDNMLLNGLAQNSERYSEDVVSPFPGMDTITRCPKVEPYGFHSRAPKGTPSVVAQLGAHLGSKYVVGHRDGSRPEIAEGESTTYSVAGYEVRVGLASITIRKGATVFTAVVGEPLAALLSAMLEAIATHDHSFTVNGVEPGLGSVGGTTDPPGNASTFTDLKAQVDDGDILAEDGGAF